MSPDPDACDHQEVRHERKYDGGNCPLLCGKCRRIIGTWDFVHGNVLDTEETYAEEHAGIFGYPLKEKFPLGAMVKAKGVPNDQATYGIVIGAEPGYSTISMLGHDDYRTGKRPEATWCFIQNVANSRYEIVKEPR